MKRNPDTGQTIAIVTIVGAVGYGLYSWLKGKEQPEKQWIKLAEKSLVVSASATYAWVPLASIDLSVNMSQVGLWVPLASVSLPISIATTSGWSGWIPLSSLDIYVYQLETYTLNTAAIPIYGGWVTKEPDKDRYSYGETVLLLAHSIWPSKFGYWDCDGEWIDDNNPINFLVMGNHVLTAHFG